MSAVSPTHSNRGSPTSAPQLLTSARARRSVCAHERGRARERARALRTRNAQDEAGSVDWLRKKVSALRAHDRDASLPPFWLAPEPSCRKSEPRPWCTKWGGTLERKGLKICISILAPHVWYLYLLNTVGKFKLKQFPIKFLSQFSFVSFENFRKKAKGCL